MNSQISLQFRQGDVFIHSAEIPSDLKPVKPDTLGLVLAAGTATGHHHRIAPTFKTATLYRTEDGARMYLRVKSVKGTGKLKPTMLKNAEKARTSAEPLRTKLADLDTKLAETASNDLLNELTAIEAQLHAALEPERMYLAAKREVDIAAGAVALTHDEHDEVVIPPGDYEVYIQREYQPDGVRQVED